MSNKFLRLFPERVSRLEDLDFSGYYLVVVGPWLFDRGFCEAHLMQLEGTSQQAGHHLTLQARWIEPCEEDENCFFKTHGII